MIDKLELPARPRTYLQRLRADPRMRAMFDGWVAQATLEAEQRFPDPRDARERAYRAAEAALELAMSFVLENDGELNAVRAELDQLKARFIELHQNLPPAAVVT